MVPVEGTPPFDVLERSRLFAFLLDLIRRVYRPSLEKAVTDYGLVIVGGQSLTLWARQYLIDEMTGEDVAFVASDDLDFIGNPASIDYCAKQLGIEFKKASIDDHTPNLAVAYIDWGPDDKEVVVDILGAEGVAGISNREIFKYLAVVDVDGVEVAVIDPITCIKSRVANLFAYWQSDRKREAVRVRTAIRATYYYLLEILGHEGYRAVAPHIRRIRKYATCRQGRRLYIEHGIDVLKAIPNDPTGFPGNYIEIGHPRLVQAVACIRGRKIEHYKQYTPGAIHVSHLDGVVCDPR
ncbi:hypothetical protein ALQ04_00575 [Pseudomonas cichorii]|uniref:Uncharacterized protein n=1 Tax=Pseudomonas cichorii TaxID=36746 RepID=A0A3M4LKF2_PSECI|nr:hypothetical protein ALQ04_00575 [Pseudomonas cichorii]